MNLLHKFYQNLMGKIIQYLKKIIKIFKGAKTYMIYHKKGRN